MKRIAPVLLLAACPSDPAFEERDGVVATDTVADVEPESDQETPCENLCPVWMQYGNCGPSDCGPCSCPSASACEVDLCQVLLDYDVPITSQQVVPIAAVVDAFGVPSVISAALSAFDERQLERNVFTNESWGKTRLYGQPLMDELLGVAAGNDAQGALQVLVATTDVVRWLDPDRVLVPFVDDAPCSGPIMRRDDAGLLYGGCQSADGELTIATLVNTQTPYPTWHVEAVHEGLDGRAAWTIDSGPRPRLAYVAASGDVVYEVWNGAQWLDLTIGHVALREADLRVVAIAVDTDGIGHVIHRDQVDNTFVLVHRWQDGLEWTSEELDRAATTTASIGNVLLIEAGNGDRLHLVYQDGDRLKYRMWKSNHWTNEQASSQTIDPPTVVASLVIDPGQNPHIAYQARSGAIRWWTPADPTAE